MNVGLGWRKLSAWLLVFALCAVVAIKSVFAGASIDIPPGVIDLIKWVTGFFFGANVVEHLAGKVQVVPNGKTT
jgi:hypothetical protein